MKNTPKLIHITKMTKTQIRDFETKLANTFKKLDVNKTYRLNLGKKELRLLDEIEGEWDYKNIIIVPSFKDESLFEIE